MSISETSKEGFELRLDNNGVREEFEFELLVVLGRLFDSRIWTGA